MMVHDSTDTLIWLLDPGEPDVCAAVLRRLYGRSREDGAVCLLRERMLQEEPCSSLLAAQSEDGSWRGSRLYTPKHHSTFYVLKVLGDWGLDKSHPGVRRGAEFAFRFQGREGEVYQIRQADGGPPARQLPVPCVTSRLAAYLVRLGYAGDPRVHRAFAHLESRQRPDGGWSCTGRSEPVATDTAEGCVPMAMSVLLLARSLREEGVDLRKHEEMWTRAQRWTTEQLVKQLEGIQPDRTPRDHWSLLSYPCFTFDLIDALHVLLDTATTGRDREAAERGFHWLEAKAGPGGRWPLERWPYRPPVPVGRRGQANKWITLRALEVLQRADRLEVPHLSQVAAAGMGFPALPEPSR